MAEKKKGAWRNTNNKAPSISFNEKIRRAFGATPMYESKADQEYMENKKRKKKHAEQMKQYANMKKKKQKDY